MTIQEIDAKLEAFREIWLESAGAEKERIMQKINAMLDKRLELMKGAK